MISLFFLAVIGTIYTLHRYCIKTRLWKRILTICLFASLLIWTVYQGILPFVQINIWYIIGSLAIVYPVYLLSLFIVGTKFTKDNLFPFSCFSIKGPLRQKLVKESLFNIYSSTYEELLFRWFFCNALFDLTHSHLLAILITIIVFFAVHIRKGIAIVQMLDILTFSLVITLWFYFSVNPINCIIVHILRNQLVICQKYVAIQKEIAKKQRYLKLMKGKNQP